MKKLIQKFRAYSSIRNEFTPFEFPLTYISNKKIQKMGHVFRKNLSKSFELIRATERNFTVFEFSLYYK